MEEVDGGKAWHQLFPDAWVEVLFEKWGDYFETFVALYLTEIRLIIELFHFSLHIFIGSNRSIAQIYVFKF